MWLASRGLDYFGVDVSPVAIELAQDLAQRSGLADQCRFEVFDLDDGLPPGDQVDVILSYLFLDRRLTEAMIQRLKPGGLLAIATLSEVDAGPGEYRAAPGELLELFEPLEITASGEADGTAWLIGRRRQG